MLTFSFIPASSFATYRVLPLPNASDHGLAFSEWSLTILTTSLFDFLKISSPLCDLLLPQFAWTSHKAARLLLLRRFKSRAFDVPLQLRWGRKIGSERLEAVLILIVVHGATDVYSCMFQNSLRNWRIVSSDLLHGIAPPFVWAAESKTPGYIQWTTTIWGLGSSGVRWPLQISNLWYTVSRLITSR